MIGRVKSPNGETRRTNITGNWRRKMLRFSDGVNIKTDGPLRIIHLKDGYYVVGEGFCIPVDNYREGEETIADMKKRR
jgi:hypothetical protein